MTPKKIFIHTFLLCGWNCCMFRRYVLLTYRTVCISYTAVINMFLGFWHVPHPIVLCQPHESMECICVYMYVVIYVRKTGMVVTLSIFETISVDVPHWQKLVGGHRKTKAYLRRFKIIKEPTCPCGTAEQTTEHVIYECETLTKDREKLKTTATQKGSWPANKKDLIRKHYRDFVKFINDILFDKLNAE